MVMEEPASRGQAPPRPESGLTNTVGSIEEMRICIFDLGEHAFIYHIEIVCFVLYIIPQGGVGNEIRRPSEA